MCGFPRSFLSCFGPYFLVAFYLARDGLSSSLLLLFGFLLVFHFCLSWRRMLVDCPCVTKIELLQLLLRHRSLITSRIVLRIASRVGLLEEIGWVSALLSHHGFE